MRKLILLSALLLALPVTAQEQTAFTPEDAEAMTACLDGVDTSEAGEGAGSPADCIGAASGQCMEGDENGSSTIVMVECLARETDWWDSQLNVHYSTLEETLEPELFDALRKAQRAWIAYRDESCGFEYELWSAGTIRQLVHASCMLDQTGRRAMTLDSYVNRTP